MAATERNQSYAEKRYLKHCPPTIESTYQKFTVVLPYYTVLTLTVWGDQCDHYKLLCKLRQVMRIHILQLDISYMHSY